MLNRRFALGTIVMSVVLLSSQVVYAAPWSRTVAGAPKTHKEKMVSFSVRNDSKVPLSVKAGETLMMLEPGKTVGLKLPVGAQLVAQETTPSFAAGTVLTTVRAEMGDVTLALK